MTFTVVATGTLLPPSDINGRRMGGSFAAPILQRYAIPAASQADAGAYTVELYNGAGLATSTPATLSVANAGAVTAGPQSESISTGTTTTLTVSAVGTGLTYQWQFDGLPISGATEVLR